MQDSNNEQLQADKNINQINQKVKQINEKKKQHKGEVGEKSCSQNHNNLQIGYDVITDQTKKNVWNKKLTIPRSQNTSRKKENSTRTQSREQQFKSKDNKSSQEYQLVKRKEQSMENPIKQTRQRNRNELQPRYSSSQQQNQQQQQQQQQLQLGQGKNRVKATSIHYQKKKYSTLANLNLIRESLAENSEQQIHLQKQSNQNQKQ
ncbi:hypothetical protein PPERSA_11971 [Pseudocohnilembus persalinus]|uniref:Uncharacterized protein n=1 Tax=Pseudocohnilembus persalinus TaxID=266149 RepID=A0A0V0QK95_PSEPJ|nr:hypothetical protein PPERSA_11971 [Pseudocohnilembus persalinus]|eukprot:KRX02631.1 hypothetical protein PPERSA_11971 [Pseudocohnilembus persalinus]